MEARKPKKPKTARAAGLADQVAEAAHETIDEIQERAAKAEQRLVRRVEAGGQSVTSRAGGVVQRVTSYIEEHPFASVTLAFGVGILATAMLRAAGVDLASLLASEPAEPEDEVTG